jgi:hypothetical protein
VPVVPKPQVQEVPVPRVQVAPVTQVQDGSSAALSQGVPARVQLVADDTPLGADSVEVDGADPDQTTMSEVCVVTWWCVVPVLVCLGAQPRAT